MSIKAIIVDDELDNREILARFLGKYCPEVEVCASHANIVDAEAYLEKISVDLLFLDIEMPFGNAFDLLAKLDLQKYEVIFVTAFSQYAIQALNLSAAHYILKPVDIDDLRDAVEKVQERLQEKKEVNHASILLDNLGNVHTQEQSIVLPLLDGFEVRKVKEIVHCEANDNFTHIHFNQGPPAMICRKLKHFEQVLSPLGFCRIHRSTIVNLEFVAKYIKGKGGQVRLKNGEEFEVSNTRKKELLEKFGL